LSLGARLRERIEREGPLTFAAYMEAALYDPQEGFYARGQKLGLGGAFSTAPTRHPKFAQAVAAEARAVGGAVVEVGPGDGTLAAALATALGGDVELVLVERAAGMRAVQERRLAGARVRWVERPQDAGVARGLVVANELFDALPVHLLDGADELCVGVDGERLVEVRRPAPEDLVALAGGVRGRVAVAPGAAAMLGALAGAVESGRLLVVDYGTDGPAAGPSPVRTYLGGRAGGGVLEAPGSQDLTADVDFALLRRTARELGLTEIAYEPQAAWLARRTLPALRGTEAWFVERTLAELPFQALLLEKS
jgi:SAM-dependent MidA family methyltransferase